MKCPICGNEMISGYIEGDGRKPLIWIPDEEKEKGFINRITTAHDMLSKVSVFGNTKLKCNRCMPCKKIIIDM